jgi:hypothetical protein
MTWGELKRQVEEYQFFDDDTEVLVCNEKGLFCEITDELIVDVKDRIVLGQVIYKCTKDKLKEIVNKVIK